MRGWPCVSGSRHGAAACLLFCAACGGGGTPSPQGTPIVTDGIESYVTDHNGYARARISRSLGAADDRILAGFEDADPGDPAGYRNLITLEEARYRDTMSIEVIAEVQGDGGAEQVVRILRLTADQAPLRNVGPDGKLIASGKFYFRGIAEVYARRDGGPLLRGRGELVNMVADFDSQTVDINLRTPYDPGSGSQIETEINALRLPFNVVTGAFGGAVQMTSRSEVSGEVLLSSGVLRGSITGDAASLTRLTEAMTGSGLFTVGSPAGPLAADGVFYGGQLNPGD